MNISLILNTSFAAKNCSVALADESIHPTCPLVKSALAFNWSGAEGIRTPDLFLAKEAFSRLNYGPGVISDFKFYDQIRDRLSAICNQKSEIPDGPLWT